MPDGVLMLVGGQKPVTRILRLKLELLLDGLLDGSWLELLDETLLSDELLDELEPLVVEDELGLCDELDSELCDDSDPPLDELDEELPAEDELLLDDVWLLDDPLVDEDEELLLEDRVLEPLGLELPLGEEEPDELDGDPDVLLELPEVLDLLELLEPLELLFDEELLELRRDEEIELLLGSPRPPFVMGSRAVRSSGICNDFIIDLFRIIHQGCSCRRKQDGIKLLIRSYLGFLTDPRRIPLCSHSRTTVRVENNRHWRVGTDANVY